MGKRSDYKTDSPEPTYRFYALIREIPGDEGFWKIRAEQSFLASGEAMVRAGMPEATVLDILTSLYWDTAECFGGA